MPFYLSLLRLPIDLSLSARDLSSIWSEIRGCISSLTTRLLLQLWGFSAGLEMSPSFLLLLPQEKNPQLLGLALEDVF